MSKRKVQKFFFLSQSQKTAELVEGTEAFFNRRPDNKQESLDSDSLASLAFHGFFPICRPASCWVDSSPHLRDCA
jgi:hypothetical protein